MPRIAIIASHPVQYYAPLFRYLARRVDLTVFYAHRATPEQQAAAGFGQAFEWDINLFEGYHHSFLVNVAKRPGTNNFFGCDTPQIFEKLHEGQFDALMTTGWNLKTYAQSVFAAKRLGLPVIVRGDSQLETPRSLFKRALKDLTYPLALSLFDAGLYVGARSRAYFEHYGFRKDRLFFSPHSVDNEWFVKLATRDARIALRRSRGIPDEVFLLLFAGKLVPFKRPMDLIAAAAACRATAQPVEVMVAGSGELESSLNAEAERLGVPLHLLGFQNQSQMPAAYAASDILVIPSDGRETWGLVANESLACGRPIIASEAVGCAPDLASDGCIGRTFPVGDIKALSGAIERARASPPPYESIARLSNQYSIGASIEGFLAAINTVIARRHAAS